MAAHDRPVVGVHVPSLALPILCDFIYPDLFVPAGDGKEVIGLVRRGGEREIGDGILGRVGQRDVLVQVANGVCGSRAGRRRAPKEARHCGGSMVASRDELLVTRAR